MSRGRQRQEETRIYPPHRPSERGKAAGAGMVRKGDCDPFRGRRGRGRRRAHPVFRMGRGRRARAPVRPWRARAPQLVAAIRAVFRREPARRGARSFRHGRFGLARPLFAGSPGGRVVRGDRQGGAGDAGAADRGRPQFRRLGHPRGGGARGGAPRRRGGGGQPARRAGPGRGVHGGAGEP